MNKKSSITNKRILIIPLSGLIAFIIIAYFVMTKDVLVFDTVVREYIYSIRNDYLTLVMTGITYLGNWQTITLLCIVFLIYKYTRISYGIPLTIAAIISSQLKDILKHTFIRERPDIYLHLIQQGGYSYPSGHSMTSMIFYGLVIFLCKQKMKNKTVVNTITVLFSILIILIGFSRIYLGVHYPTDVLAGWSLGLCLLIIMSNLILIFKQKNRNSHS